MFKELIVLLEVLIISFGVWFCDENKFNIINKSVNF